MAKPYYQVDFSAAACLFEIRVNDVIAFTHNIVGQVGTMVPINQAILGSGKQEVTIRVLPMHGEHTVSANAEFKYDIKVFDVTSGFNLMQQLPGYEFPKVDTSKQHLSLENTKSFDAEVPFSIQAQQNGTDLRTIPDLESRLRGAYQYIAGLISQKNYDQLRKEFDMREKNIATQMYLDQRESADRLNGLIHDFERGFICEPIAAHARVQVYGDNKIASLKKPDGESALVLLNKQTGEEMTIELAFYIPQGGKEMLVI